MSISSKLLQVNQVKQDIKDAIEDKGIDMTDTPFTDYADKIDSIPVQKEEEEKTVSTPSFASGNIVVEPTTNKVMTKVTINKDTTNHIGENIKDGVTLYGIQGSLQPAKEEETKTISNADFASGNIVVEPTTNKVMTKVTINKDTTNHIGENIKDGVTLYGIQGSLQPAKTEQEKTVSNPNFSAGDVVVTPDANKVLSKATVKKDANLVAGNIKDGVTIFGVEGNVQVAKTEQEKTVTTPNFSAGDVVVTPDANKVLSKATVKKDANLVANNIKDGVTLFGVTGSLPVVVELTQAQYDALPVYDNNTYYLIVEE